MVLDMTDYLEALFTGKLKYIGWMLIGSLTIGTLRVLYGLWLKKLAKGDAAFVQRNLSVPIGTFKKKANWILLSIVLLFVIYVVTTWIAVEILKGIESSPDWLNVLIVFALALVFLISSTVQFVRYGRLYRRIKLMAKTGSNQDPSVNESSNS